MLGFHKLGHNCESDSDFYPSPAKKLCAVPISMGKTIFVCDIVHLQQLIDRVNLTSNCYTPRCTGKLVPVNVKLAGLGGALYSQVCLYRMY